MVNLSLFYSLGSGSTDPNECGSGPTSLVCIFGKEAVPAFQSSEYNRSDSGTTLVKGNRLIPVSKELNVSISIAHI